MSKLQDPSPLAQVHLDLDALSHNLNVVLELANRKKVIAVVKADAYGHGAVTIARHIAPSVHSFAVAQPSEGIQLRKAGIAHPILVLCTPQHRFMNLYTEWGLDAAVGDLTTLQTLPAGTRLHLKFDTGMRRLGFQPNEADDVLRVIQSRTDLQIVGILSHLANADIPGHNSNDEQLNAFEHVSRIFPSEWMRHLSNSAATLSMDQALYDAIRVGLLLYGYSPNQMSSPRLKPVKIWKSTVSQVRPIASGTPVSYGWTWQAPTDGWLGVVPVGYADGYPRSASSRAHVDLHDGSAEIAGRVTMDYIMIFTNRRPLTPDEEVILLGGPNSTADLLAQASGTISYDILCQTGKRRQGL